MPCGVLIMRDDFFRLEGATATLPASTTGFSGERLRDESKNYQWQADGTGTKHYEVDLGDGTGDTPGALEPEYIAIMNHNLAKSGSTWNLQYSDDGAIWSDATGAQTPPNNRDIVKDVQSVGAGARRYWRLEIEAGATTCAISEVMLGRYVDLDDVLQAGFVPRQNNMRQRVTRSDTGIILRTVAKDPSAEFSYSIDLLRTTLVNSATESTGFRWWWENVGSQGLPSLFHWQVLDYAEDNPYEHDGIFTRLMQRPSAPFPNRTPDIQSLNFVVGGRRSFRTEADS